MKFPYVEKANIGTRLGDGFYSHLITIRSDTDFLPSEVVINTDVMTDDVPKYVWPFGAGTVESFFDTERLKQSSNYQILAEKDGTFLYVFTAEFDPSKESSLAQNLRFPDNGLGIRHTSC